MKKLFLIATLALFASCISAQSTTPRFGITKNQDNTGRVLTYGANTITATSVIVSFVPSNKYYNLITLASTSLSPTFNATTTNAALGDNVDLLVLANSTGARVITFSTNIIGNTALTYTVLGTSSTTVALPASKQALFSFKFDGAKFVWVSQSIQP